MNTTEFKTYNYLGERPKFAIRECSSCGKPHEQCKPFPAKNNSDAVFEICPTCSTRYMYENVIA
jgi:hypothetical protein